MKWKILIFVGAALVGRMVSDATTASLAVKPPAIPLPDGRGSVAIVRPAAVNASHPRALRLEGGLQANDGL